MTSYKKYRLISKILMIVTTLISVIVIVFSGHANDISMDLNLVVDFIVMAICAIIWSSIQVDENNAKSDCNKYLQAIILANYMGAAFTNSVAVLKGNSAYRIAIYLFNIGVFLSFAGMLLVFSIYLLHFKGTINRKAKTYKRIYLILTGIHLAIIVSSPFTHLYFYVDSLGNIHYPNTYGIAGVYALIMILMNSVWIIKNAKEGRKRLTLFSYLFVWIIGAILDVVAVYEQVTVSAESLLELLFLISIIWIFCDIYAKQRNEYLENKEELATLQVKAMISQIEPHFIFNTLGTIDSLCVEDTERARTVIERFSDYLRAYYQNLTEKPMISIEQEIENLKTYTEIEQIRFRRLKVCFELERTAFELPKFTLQPLVENAIKHGICPKKKSEGVVTIATSEDESNYIITIVDDGVGFPTKLKDDDKPHVGILNVEQRLKLLCNGTLNIESEPEKGTRCMIKIPKMDKRGE